jgi:uncharacterized protein
MANYYVSNPIEVVSVGEKVKVRVLDIDEEREKVSLSMKDPSQIQDSRKKSQDPGKRDRRSQESERRDFDAESSGMRSNITFS